MMNLNLLSAIIIIRLQGAAGSDLGVYKNRYKIQNDIEPFSLPSVKGFFDFSQTYKLQQ